MCRAKRPFIWGNSIPSPLPIKKLAQNNTDAKRAGKKQVGFVTDGFMNFPGLLGSIVCQLTNSAP